MTEIIEPKFPLANRFTIGERIVIPGRDGSYPDHTKNEWGYVTDIRRDVVTEVRETLVVTLDGQEPRGINPDVVAHGDDWRYAKYDPKSKETEPLMVTVKADDLSAVLNAVGYMSKGLLVGPVDNMSDALILARMKKTNKDKE